MNEAERVAYYDAGRDDPQEFIEVAETPVDRERGSLSVTVAVRFSAPEAEALQRTAQLEGKTYSEIVRTAVQRYTQPNVVLEPNRENLLPVFASQTPLTRTGNLVSPATVVFRPASTQTESSAARQSG